MAHKGLLSPDNVVFNRSTPFKEICVPPRKIKTTDFMGLFFQRNEGGLSSSE